MKHFTERNTQSPGPRTRVTLDVAETGLADLVKGIGPAEDVRLVETEDGVYSFHASITMGESRKQAGKPAADQLTDYVNQLGDALEADDVPQRLRDLWNQLLDQYLADTAPPPPPAP